MCEPIERKFEDLVKVNNCIFDTPDYFGEKRYNQNYIRLLEFTLYYAKNSD